LDSNFLNYPMKSNIYESGRLRRSNI
jgi:hypothetical protein